MSVMLFLEIKQTIFYNPKFYKMKLKHELKSKQWSRHCFFSFFVLVLLTISTNYAIAQELDVVGNGGNTFALRNDAGVTSSIWQSYYPTEGQGYKAFLQCFPDARFEMGSIGGKLRFYSGSNYNMDLTEDGDLQIIGGISFGDYAGAPVDGAIKYSSGEFEGYKAGVWTALTSPWEESANGISYNNVEIHDSGSSGRIDFTSSSHVYQLSPEGATFTMRDDGTYKYGYYGGTDEVGPTSNNSLKLGSSTYRWMEIWSVNPLNTSSDKRLKKEIKPLQYGLSEILLLNPVQYKWIDGHDKEMIGLIAQDVEPIIPNVVGHHKLTREQINSIESEGGGRVVTEENKDSYSMSYSQLIPVLINSVKELNAELEILKAELAELKEEK